MIDYRLNPLISRLWIWHEHLKHLTAIQMVLKGRGVDHELHLLREEILSEMAELIRENEENWGRRYGVTHHHGTTGDGQDNHCV